MSCLEEEVVRSAHGVRGCYNIVYIYSAPIGSTVAVESPPCREDVSREMAEQGDEQSGEKHLKGWWGKQQVTGPVTAVADALAVVGEYQVGAGPVQAGAGLFRLQVKHLALLLLFLGCTTNLTSASKQVPDLEAAESVASDYKVQSVVATGSNGKYGYPYRIAPTLAPVIQARSDDDEKETAPVIKSYGSRISGTTDDTLKKGNQKKSKVFEATRRQDEGNDYIDKFFRNYREPKYRNFEELEADFLPKRRIDTSIAYSQYEYPKPGRKPSISSRDPFLSASPEALDAFYPSSPPKIKSGYSSYGSHSNRDVPSYGAGRYEDPLDYHSDSYAGPSPSYPSSGGSSLSYPSSGGPSSYSTSGGSPLSYPSSGGSSLGYPSSGGSSYQSGSPYYHGDYSIKSNEPIMGDIRKKLLDYAGASDHYEGEPDYLREVARNKYKYGNLGNDYYTYGGQGYRDSYRDFPYVESKITLVKKSRGL